MNCKDAFKCVLQQSGCSLMLVVDERGEEAGVWSKSSIYNCQQILDDLFSVHDSIGEMKNSCRILYKALLPPACTLSFLRGAGRMAYVLTPLFVLVWQVSLKCCKMLILEA